MLGLTTRGPEAVVSAEADRRNQVRAFSSPRLSVDQFRRGVRVPIVFTQ